MKSRITSLLFLIVTLSVSICEAANFHVLLVGDTKSNLREQVVADLSMMHEQSIQLARAVGAAPKIRVIRENQVSRNEILTAVDRLNLQPDDYLLFYFSGHGFRTEQKKSKWPNLYFPEVDQYIALDEIIEHLKPKKMKFGLIVADCCNNSFAQEWPDTEEFDFQTQERRHISPSIRNLFENSKGLLVVSASEPGTYAWASDEGGILTCALLDGMSYSQYHPSKNWRALMSEIQYKTEGIQRPQYQLIY